MYKIIIVDDEEIVREGIRDNVLWNSLGIEFVGEAEDGLAACKLINSKQPDIVLVDICMPHMDGLQLTRFVKDTHPDCEVIIVTGYDEFDYAQQAIRLGVYDYILKPITCTELTELLKKIVKQLDLKKKKKKEVAQVKEQLYESIPLLKNKTLNQLINGEVSQQNVKEKMDMLQIGNDARLYCVVLIDIDNFSEVEVNFRHDEVNLIQFALLNISNEIISDSYAIDSEVPKELVPNETKSVNGFAFKTEQNEIALLFYSDTSKEDTWKEIHQILLEIRQAVMDNLKFTMSIGIGRLYYNIYEVHKSYREAQRALDYRFFLGDDSIIHINDIKQQEDMKFQYPKQLEQKLVSALKGSYKQEVMEIINEMFLHMKNSGAGIEMCKNTILEMIIVMFKTFAEMGFQLDDVFEQRIDILNDMKQFKNLKEIEQWIESIYVKVVSYIENKPEDPTKMHILKAKEYIDTNYSNKDISFKAMCSYMHLSPSYFSWIFKKEMGETFTVYLTKVRIEKAKELLKNSYLRTYEIADKIGYSDPHYFSSIFKKVTNMSPTEYRAKVREE
ncbi:MAG: two-component system, response regulator YesN [Clostridiales bacterium]|nr:two-component system, response regulator YesN [Clostridiales bacterium]